MRRARAQKFRATRKANGKGEETMSRGPSHIERTLVKTFASYPTKAFSVGELCLFVWPD